MGNKSTTRSFGILTGLTIIEKMVSFIYQAAIAAVLGASVITDSYFASSQLITLIDSTFFSGLVIALLNRYTIKLSNSGREDALSFLSDGLSWTIVFSLALSCAVFAFARPISLIIAPGFYDAGRQLLVRDIRILAIIPTLIGCSSVYATILRNERDFLAIGLKSLFLSVLGIAVLILIYLTKTKDVISLAYGQLIAIFLYFLFIISQSRKYGSITVHKLEWGDDQRTVIKMLLPIIVSNGITRVSMMIDRVIASNIGEGAVSYITYSHTLYDVVHTLLIANLCIILLSDFTSLAAEKKNEDIKEKLSNAITFLLYILSFVTVITLCYSRNIVEIVYGRGHFSTKAILGTEGLLFFYAFCFAFSAVNNVYIRVFYAYGKTKQTMYISLISMIANITASIILSHKIGLNGIAVGTIIATVLMTAIYSVLIRGILPGFHGFRKKKDIAHVCIIIAICVLSSFCTKTLIHHTLMSFVIAVGLSAVLSFGLLSVLKDQYVMAGIKILNKHFSRTRM